MLKLINRFHEDREEGFTMVEMMVTVAIVLALTAIAIPTYLNQRKSGWRLAVNQDVSNAAMYIAQNKNALGGYQDYSSDIPGFNTSEGVVLNVFGENTIGQKTACIEGYHQNDTSTDQADTRWYILLSDREIKRGTCSW